MIEIDRLRSTLKLNATFHDLLYNDENNFIVLIVYFFPFFCCSCNCICKLELFVLWLCDLILLNGVKQFLGDRKGIRPVKSWVLVYWWWRFDWSLARIYLQLSPPPPSSLAPIKPANPASPGKMAEKNGECCEKNSSWWYNMILSTAVTSALWLLVCSDVSVSWWNLGQRLLTQWSASVNRSPLHSRWFERVFVSWR